MTAVLLTLDHVCQAVEKLFPAGLESAEGRPAVTEEAKFDDLNIDSLDVVEVIFAIEDALGRKLPLKVEDARSVGELIDLANHGLEAAS